MREYVEMPGLCLTENQVRRLLSVDERTCQRSLEALIAKGLLKRKADGQYVCKRHETTPRLEGPGRQTRGSTPTLMRVATLTMIAAFVAGGIIGTPIPQLVVLVALGIGVGAAGWSLVKFLEWRQNFLMVPRGIEAGNETVDGAARDLIGMQEARSW